MCFLLKYDLYYCNHGSRHIFGIAYLDFNTDTFLATLINTHCDIP